MIGIAVAAVRVAEHPLREQDHVRGAYLRDEAGGVIVQIVLQRRHRAAARPQIVSHRRQLARIAGHEQQLFSPLRPDPGRGLRDGGGGAEDEHPHRVTRRQNDDENAGSR